MSENQKEPQYKLRWNEDLRNKVMNSAKANNRSINQEIIVRLEESFNPPMEFKSDDKEMITKIVALSMQTLLETLHDEGVEDLKLANAVSKIANKKHPRVLYLCILSSFYIFVNFFLNFLKIFWVLIRKLHQPSN